MADQDPINRGNGSGDPENDPQVATIAQYIKDLSVESPSSPQAFQWSAQPQLEVQFNIGVEKVGDDVHEVILKIEVAARSDQGVHFLIDLSYAGLYGLRNFPDEALPPFLLIEAPRLLFPFARQIIADASQNTGFPPLLLDPIDFGAAYMAQLQAAEQLQAAGQGKAAEQGQAAEQSQAAGQDQPAGQGNAEIIGKATPAASEESSGNAEPTDADTPQG
jgi:preprotein translocase subunit SecB